MRRTGIPRLALLKVFVAELDSSSGRTELRITRDKWGLPALERFQLDIGRLNAVHRSPGPHQTALGPFGLSSLVAYHIISTVALRTY